MSAKVVLLCICFIVAIASAQGGPPGPRGQAGPPGTSYYKGQKGQKGSVGPSGPKGTKGSTGERGDWGIPGLPGHRGIKGPTGPTGLRGPHGRPGRPGVPGVVGPMGTNGSMGIDGTNGSPGLIGLPGHTGPPGPPGPPGIQTFEKGEQGASGKTFVYWGRETCGREINTRLYSGVATTNSAGSPLCLPRFCDGYGDGVCSSFDVNSKSEFTFESWKEETISEITYLKNNSPLRLECSVCFNKLASSIVTFPASIKCPIDWVLEYKGVLSQVWEVSGDFFCVDPNDSAQPPGGENFHRLAAVDVDCFDPDCKRSKENHRLPCVVCSFSQSSKNTPVFDDIDY